jgi:hypothetical protein
MKQPPPSPRAHSFEALSARGATADEALALFDQLEVVSLDAMLGRWRVRGSPPANRWMGCWPPHPKRGAHLLRRNRAERANCVPRRTEMAVDSSSSHLSERDRSLS